MVYFPSRLLLQRLRVVSIFYPFLRFLIIWAIPSDMALVFSMEETILPPLLLVLVLAPASILIVSSVILLPL
jgi:4-amino-4-deoxy-L-arabinose transferase-like glycosyltransferase